MRDRGLDGGNGVVFGVAPVAVGAGAAVQSQHGDARVFRQPGNPQGILVFTVPARAKFQGDGHVDGGHHRVEDAGHQVFVLQQGRTAPVVAHLLHRAAHVDVDDLGAPLHIETGAVGQVLGIGARDLHRFRLHFARMVGAAAAFFAGPQAGIRGRHLGHGVARAQLLAQLAEGTVRHARHGRDEHIITQQVRTDLHSGREKVIRGTCDFTLEAAHLISTIYCCADRQRYKGNSSSASRLRCATSPQASRLSLPSSTAKRLMLALSTGKLRGVSSARPRAAR